MSDVMLLGVLRMPLPHDPDPLTPLAQFVARARQAADRIEADAERIERLTAERDALREALLRLKRLNDTGLYREEIVFEGSGRYAVDIDTVNEIGEVIDAALAAKEQPR